MSGFAGSMRERVALFTPTAARDALGAAGEDWTLVEMVWTSVAPEAGGAPFAGEARSALPLWRLTMRPCTVQVGDRIDRANGILIVRQVIRDPRTPDRVIAIGEQRR